MLNVESLQDTSKLDAKQQNAGFGVSLCIPPLCYGSSSVSVNVGKASVNGDYANVVEESGIKAGEGGFQVNVAGNTDLKGGVISSTQAAQQAGVNSLVTASLTHSDIQNRDSFKGSGFSIGATFSGKLGDQSTATTDVQRLRRLRRASPGEARASATKAAASAA